MTPIHPPLYEARRGMKPIHPPLYEARRGTGFSNQAGNLQGTDWQTTNMSNACGSCAG